VTADVVGVVLAASAARDWPTVRAHLHPYVHWRGADGRLLRGRTNVLALLEHAHRLAPPSSYELRDGQIYRWDAPPASDR